MSSFIYVDSGGIEIEDKSYLIEHRGSLCDSGRAIQGIAGSAPWAPASTPEITRAILRSLGIFEDVDVAALNDNRIPHGEPYWMIDTADDTVCLGCGDIEFIDWDREEFTTMNLSEARCRRLKSQIRAISFR